MGLPQIFLSYASEDDPWVRNFADEFASKIGTIKVLDFKHGDNLDFGEIGKWVDENIHSASAVVCFVSEYYRQKHWTLDELRKTVTEFRRRRLIFVPIMLDVEAKAWWARATPKG